MVGPGVADNAAPASVNVNFTLNFDAAGISLQAQKWNRWTGGSSELLYFDYLIGIGVVE